MQINLACLWLRDVGEGGKEKRSQSGRWCWAGFGVSRVAVAGMESRRRRLRDSRWDAQGQPSALVNGPREGAGCGVSESGSAQLSCCVRGWGGVQELAGVLFGGPEEACSNSLQNATNSPQIVSGSSPQQPPVLTKLQCEKIRVLPIRS